VGKLEGGMDIRMRRPLREGVHDVVDVVPSGGQATAGERDGQVRRRDFGERLIEARAFERERIAQHLCEEKAQGAIR
jgi:hypothetical protein